MENGTQKGSLARRSICYIGGILLMALGNRLLIATGLGVPPVTSLPYTFTFLTPLSYGTLTFLNNFLTLIIQAAVSREFHPVNLVQLGMVIFFSFFLDFIGLFTSLLHPSGVVLLTVLLLISCFIYACGIGCMVLSFPLVMPVEGMIKAIAARLGRPFSTIKTWTDIVFAALSIVISLAALGSLVSVGIGTIVAALITGSMVRIFYRLFERPLLRFMGLRQRQNA